MRHAHPLRPAQLLRGLAALALLACPALAQQSVRQMLTDAARLRAQARYAEAERTYREALPLCANDAERAQVWFGLGSVHRPERNSGKALEAYTEITRLQAAPEGYLISAWRQIGQLHLEAEDWAQARAAQEHLLRDFPEDPEVATQATLDLAQLDVQEGRGEAAVERLRKLAREQPKSPRAPDIWYTLVQAQVASEDFAGAEASAREGMRAFPDHTAIMLGLILGLRDKGRAAQAIPLAWETLAPRPLDDTIFRGLLDLHRETGSIPQLTKWLEQQSRQEGREAIWLERLAQVYLEEREDAAAVGVYERLLAKNPTDPNLLRNAGQAALRAGQFAKAEKWLQQCLALRPDDEGLALSLGEVYLQQGQPAEATRFWREGLHYRPADREAAGRFAGTLQRHGLNKEALAVYQEARAALSDPRAFSAQVGQTQEALLDFAAATREYVAALADPAARGPGLAGMRLQALAEDAAARPEARAALEAIGPDKLPPEAQATLLYARILDGEDPLAALAALPAGDDDPARASLVARLAHQLETGGRHEAAAAAYGRVLAALPDPMQKAALALHVSKLRGQSGDWRGALQTLESVLGQGVPESIARRVTLARADLLLRQARRPREARELWQAIAAEHPGGEAGLRARWGLADCAYALGEYDEARKLYGRLLLAGARVPDEDEPLPPLVIGAFYLPVDEETDRVRLPGDDYVAFRQAEMLFREGQAAEAKKAFGEVSGRHPASPYANDALERVLLMQSLTAGTPGAEAYREALQAFERGDGDLALELLGGIQASPLAEVAALLAAEVQLWQGRRAESLATLRKLAGDHPDSPQAPEALLRAALWQYQDDAPAARQQLQDLITRYPEAPEAAEAKALLQVLQRMSGRDGRGDR